MTISDIERRAIQSLRDDLTPQQLAFAFGVSINSVKRILKEDSPPDNWYVSHAWKKYNANPWGHWANKYYLEEYEVAKSVMRTDMIESICIALSSLEDKEPYNCKWGYLRQEYLAKWVKCLEAQSKYLELNKPPKSWVDARLRDKTASRQPKEYIPYSMIRGTKAYRGYEYPPEKDRLIYEFAILRESDVGRSAINIQEELEDSIAHYQRIQEEQKAKRSKSYMTWVKLYSKAIESLHSLTELKDTWRGWHYGYGQTIQWRTI